MDEFLPESLGEIAPGTELLLASTGSSNSNGITLIFDGQTTATTKRYKQLCTGSKIFDNKRVLVLKHSGTYIVLGTISSSGKAGATHLTNSSSIGTASSYFSADYTEYTETGRVAQLRLKGTVTTALPSSVWTNLFTIASGKRPLMSRHYFRDYYGRDIQISDDGTVSAWGSLAVDAKVDFVLTYILA